jgi:hypothetical protein
MEWSTCAINAICSVSQTSGSMVGAIDEAGSRAMSHDKTHIIIVLPVKSASLPFTMADSTSSSSKVYCICTLNVYFIT